MKSLLSNVERFEKHYEARKAELAKQLAEDEDLDAAEREDHMRKFEESAAEQHAEVASASALYDDLVAAAAKHGKTLECWMLVEETETETQIQLNRTISFNYASLGENSAQHNIMKLGLANYFRDQVKKACK